MSRTFCPICGEEVEVGPDGRDDQGHDVSGVEPEPWVSDADAGAAAPAPAASTGGEGADDIDFGSLEAAVAELGLTADDGDDDAFAAFEEPSDAPATAAVDEAPAPAPAAADGPDAEAIADATEEAEPWDLDDVSGAEAPEGGPADEAATDGSPDEDAREEPPTEVDTATFTARPKGQSRGGFFRRG